MNILIIDDEAVLQDVLSSLLTGAGYSTHSAFSGRDALDYLAGEDADLVVLDLMLPDMHGLEVLKQVRQENPDQVVVVLTAYSSIESAIDAMREGAFHYIPKPFKNEEVLLTIRKGLEQRRLKRENRALKEELRERFSFDNIIGKSRPMRKVYELIELAAPANSNILVLGESGTGKELVARAVHHHSRRSKGPFVTVNSGSMPADLLESNLFGHVKGSFTGAVSNKRGLFEVAHGGSIFFDEIGTIPLDTQAKLLRVTQEREFMRLGGIETIKTDVRIIAATNADLETSVSSGAFREDLFYRLNVITVTLPPLRDRVEDVPLLSQLFLERHARENQKSIASIHPEALELLLDYHWPGNVRELENVIERAVVLSADDTLTTDLLPPTVRDPSSTVRAAVELPANGASLKEIVGSYERQLIIRALRNVGGVQKKAAELLKVKPTTLHEMMKRHNISTGSIAG